MKGGPIKFGDIAQKTSVACVNGLHMLQEFTSYVAISDHQGISLSFVF